MRMHFRYSRLFPRPLPGVVALIATASSLLVPPTAHSAQAVDAAPATTAENPPAVAVTPDAAPATVAPPDTREVVAEGRAAIGPGGVVAARKAATAQALRVAVEMTTGVYVSAHTLTRNYQMVRDQVVTHADGFATPEAVVREVVGTQEVSVTIRALVSLRPLAARLKALNLTRAWRVHVTVADTRDGTAEAIGTALEKTLGEAGLVVISGDDQADIVVRATRRFAPVSTRQERPSFGAAPHVVQTLRGVLTLRATLVGTGEVVAALTGSQFAVADTTATGVGDTARDDAMATAATDLAPRLTDALLLLPAREAQPVQLVVGKIGSAARAGRFEDALNTLPGITSVTRRRYENGSGIWELQVFSDEQPQVARDLEENAALKPFKLTVLSDTLVKIVAATNGVAPTFAPVAAAMAAPAPVAVMIKHSPAISPIPPSGRKVEGSMRTAPARNAPTPTTINPIDGAVMVWIPASSFAMGDSDPAIHDAATGVRNNPQHTVYLAGYYISRDLVTVGQYREFCRVTGHALPAPPPWGWRDDHPVVNVNWDDSRAYCAWAGVRLPTENEWEKAARGGNGRRYPWGDDFDTSRLQFGGDNRARGTASVNAHLAGASPYGVLDMAGNVWQWCADWYQPSYFSPTTGRLDHIADARRRVLRGGSWYDTDPATFRTAFRSKSDPTRRSDNIGFRTVSEPWMGGK